MAHHKVFGDLLHVFKVEECVEAKLVCKRSKKLKDWEGGGGQQEDFEP